MVGLAGLFLAFVLSSPVLCGEPGVRKPQAEVPKPIDVTIESYNFNTSVHWNYQGRSSKPLFIVEKRCYGFGSNNWTEVANCVNILQHYCDLTHKIEQCDFFWARVKALDGLHESNYTTSDVFTVIRNGKIGPPKLNLSIVNDEIHVNIENPLTPYRKKYPLSVAANLTDFTYEVFLWEKGSREKRTTFMLDECPRRRCTKNLHVPSWDASYCVSAQGISVSNDVIGEESEENCISFPPKQSSGSTVLIIVGVFVLLLVLIVLIIVYVCTYKKKIKLPKSLVSVVRSQVSSSFDIKPEGKYISVVTSSSYKPVLPEREDEKTVEHVDFVTEEKIVHLSNSGKEVYADGSQDTLSKASGEMNIEEVVVVDITGGEQDSDNYFQSVSGQQEMCNNLPTLNLPCADVQQPKTQGSCRNIGGYDKPHWQDAHPEGESLVT
ncbi:interferon gamma receptor 1 [Pogona vitticeps]